MEEREDFMKINDRVKVNIVNRDKFAMGCANNLQGQKGIIVKEQDTELSTYCGIGRFLIHFDKVVPNWWSYQTPTQDFWLDSDDLIIIS